MKKVLILHGWHGSELPHWQAWLAQELSLENCIVAFPQLSDNHAPEKETWVREALEVFDTLRPDIVVCHSLGNILWFHMCGQISHAVDKLLLCAPPRDLSDCGEVETFFPAVFPSSLHAREILMVVSDDDPYLSAQEARELSHTLQVPLQFFENAGHINAASGFGPWPWVKEWVLQ